ncbi:glycosyltransferase family 2 protein [Loigolactobacillus zhaoyuanensis]|uniref:Glycosyltransferase family 2 protein n=1 Tax=Loigolactobacillus zhaoyuanensis TaxID=2486017 RepID=A0ABW8UB82_9LACO|nr:glycosyltransferase family A protein [Loigolactobacillus zhaoyuanensis]
MMAEKQFTVIVPVYNLAPYLEQCLASLQAQTYTNFNVWLIDDASTDDSAAILAAWTQKDNRFHIWRQPTNQGVSAARNVGIQQASGDYVCFVDGDDWCEPTYLASFSEQMAQPQADMAMCGYYTDWPSLKVLFGSAETQVLDRQAMLTNVLKPSGDIRGFLWNKCYRLALIQRQQLTFDEEITLLEDQLFNVAYVLQTHCFYYAAAPQYHYVTRNDSAIHKWSPQTLPEELKALDRIQRLLKQQPKFSRLLADRRRKTRHDLAARLRDELTKK